MHTSPTSAAQESQVRMATASMLNLSTAHIPKRTATALGLDSEPSDGVLRSTLSVVDYDAYGWIIYVSDEAIEAAKEHPELANLLALAMTHRCEYLKLDCDAMTISGLPEFSW